MRLSNRAPISMRAVSLEPGRCPPCRRLLPGQVRRHPCAGAPPAWRKKRRPSCKGSGKGWVTAEYGMLPRSTHERMRREAARGQAVRPHPGDPAPGRPLLARGRAILPRWANARSSSTATCCRPMAAPAPPPITGGFVALAPMHRLHEEDRPGDKRRCSRIMSRRSPAASSRARRCSIWITTKIPPPRPTPISC